MKTLALLVAIAAVSVTQSGGASITGSWTAQFEGRTFLTLELKAVDGTARGERYSVPTADSAHEAIATPQTDFNSPTMSSMLQT